MSAQKPDTPFNLSFDQLLAQMNGGNPEAETPATAPTAAPAESASAEQTPRPASTTESHTPTFEELVAQAQAHAAQTNTAPAAPATPVTPVPASTAAPEASHTPTFEELVAQAQANAAQATETTTEPVKEEPVKEEPVKEEPVKEEPVKEEPVKEEPVKEEPVKEEPVKEEPVKEESVKEESVKEEPVKEEPVKEEPVKEDLPETGAMNPPETAAEPPKEKKPTKSAKKTKAAKKASPSKTELPEDNTESYRVSLTPTEDTEANGKETTSVMERLFSEEEVAAMRADIRHFVRKEFKLALVDAMKELLTDFNNV